MKKTIFNASFEESQNYVTEKYIIASMKDSAKKIVIKRTAGVLIMNAFLLILAIFVRWVEHEAPIINPMLASKLNIVIYLFSLLTPLYYLIKILDYKNNTILNSYYFNQTMCIITFPFSISFYLFFVSISVGITGIPWLIFIYLILLVLFFNQ
ncbi:hypothetical protein [Enterococcus rivorum]|uniref:hypothetical protein n=1 Tax=Enterococcus rivorum TaxID=762845 RepID=UPI00362D600F